jgi:hypothetical protein
MCWAFVLSKVSNLITEHFSRLQVTLKKTSELVGKGIREAGFRGRFSAAVIAGEPLSMYMHLCEEDTEGHPSCHGTGCHSLPWASMLCACMVPLCAAP